MQEKILFFFRGFDSPFLDKIVEVFTMFGEQTLIICLVVLIFWCIDKRKGEAVCTTMLFSILTMGLLKAIVRSPRPFQVLDLEGKRIETATGYSFPSGHTTTAASFYSGLAIVFRKRWISILSGIIIALVALSRMYLGVHWPIDVAFGLIFGILMSFLLVPVMYRLFESPTKTRNFSLIFAILTGTIGLILATLLSFDMGDKVAWTDFYKTLALSGGAFFGFLWEEKSVNFKVDGSVSLRILRFVVGVIGIVVIMASKKILPDLEIFGFLRYFLTGFWAFGLYPVLGKKLKLFI